MENLFIAIKLEVTPRLISLVRNTQVLMRKERMRWVPDLELHVRLANINVSGMKNIKALSDKLKEVVEGMPVFETHIRGFFNAGAHSLSAGIDQTPEFLVLRQKINEVIAEFKEPDNLDFIPNILLARMNSLNDKRLFFKLVDAHRTVEFDKIIVKDICLMSTELKAYGPVSSIEESFLLEEEMVEELV